MIRIVGLMIILVLVGCSSTRYMVEINSISSHNAESKKKYILLSGFNDVKTTDLQFKEYAEYMEKALLYRPHTLIREDGRTLEWVIYKGERRNCHINYEEREVCVNHLEVFAWDNENKRDIFPVSILCLYEDLRDAINLYMNKIEEEIKLEKHDLLSKYESTMLALIEPEETSLMW